MNAQFKATNPEELVFEATIRMKLKEWRALAAQMRNEWPSIDITYLVTDMISQAERTYYPEVVEK